jgi:Ubiquitin family
MLAKLLQVPVTMQRLFYRGRELRNMRLLHDCGIDSTGCTLFFAIHREVSQRAWALEPFDSLEPPKSLTRIMNQVRAVCIKLQQQLHTCVRISKRSVISELTY